MKDYSVKGIEKMLKKALVSQNTYSHALDITISLAAGSLYTFHKALSTLELQDLVITEKSREGFDRYVYNPNYMIMYNSAEQARKYMRELRLTRATIEPESENDDFAQLINKVEDERLNKTKKILLEKDNG